ncbi:hypothetical protein PAXINDRAFT_171521 [Paxillus involutus ATCC 200175]|uniref:Uncharacterized protein n=1 Tax=Paxillus involutus ATCC 200175 TaxID=664439 RepID=A0A0C9TVX4_PAXIN|nr:hypothetical protein PAXINDRAFT_171521 [Paxillus involutus ATCC 200175]
MSLAWRWCALYQGVQCGHHGIIAIHLRDRNSPAQATLDSHSPRLQGTSRQKPQPLEFSKLGYMIGYNATYTVSSGSIIDQAIRYTNS